jgi:3-phenylpropionate/trans-cinnamate dioxygenase ferredoxin subunit
MADFITITTTDQLKPGERIVVEIGSRWVAVFNVDGQYYAVEDRCTHDDGPLAEGDLYGCEIECPRHRARFDIRSGKFLSAPAFVDVPSYTVQVVGNEVQLATQPSKTAN